MGSCQDPQYGLTSLPWLLHAEKQLTDSAAVQNVTGGLCKGAIQIRMVRVTQYINRIQMGCVAWYINRILFSSNDPVLHGYIIGSGRPYITGRCD